MILFNMMLLFFNSIYDQIKCLYHYFYFLFDVFNLYFVYNYNNLIIVNHFTDVIYYDYDEINYVICV